MATLFVGFGLVLLVNFAFGYPSVYVGKSCKNNGHCWVPAGKVVMGQQAQSTGSITFTPKLINDKYTPGKKYILSSSNTNGQYIIGATKGAFTDGADCSCNNEVGSHSSKTWTAPAAGSGSVTIGYTSGNKGGIATVTVTIGEGPTPNPTASPTTSKPTPKPTGSPTAEPTAIPTESPTPEPTKSPTIDCKCEPLNSNDAAYCQGFDAVQNLQCESDPKCKWGPEEGLNSVTYPECNLKSTSPTTSLPTTSPITSKPTEIPTFYPSTSFPSASPVTSKPSAAPSTSRPSAVPSTSPTISEVTFTGYLIDTLCVTIVNQVDFQNTTTDADKHSRECLLLKECIDSGYTIMEKKGNNWIAKYVLKKENVQTVVDQLNAKKNCINNITATVTGKELGEAEYNGAKTYNGGAQSHGLWFDASSITVTCNGNVPYPPTSSPTAPGDSDKSSGNSEATVETAAIAVIAVIVIIAIIIIVAFEMFGKKHDSSEKSIQSQVSTGTGTTQKANFGFTSM